MGMFDTFYLDNITMPDGSKTDPNEEYQTKDLDCNLDYYRITADGRVTKADCDDAETAIYLPFMESHQIDLYFGPGYWRFSISGGRLNAISKP